MFSVHKIRDVLRLKHDARLSDRQIGAVLGVARSTVCKSARDGRTAGLTRPLPADFDNEQLRARDCIRVP